MDGTLRHLRLFTACTVVERDCRAWWLMMFLKAEEKRGLGEEKWGLMQRCSSQFIGYGRAAP